MELERVEAAMESILRAISNLSLDDVMVIKLALQAGWMTEDERTRLAPLADAFDRLGKS